MSWPQACRSYGKGKEGVVREGREGVVWCGVVSRELCINFPQVVVVVMVLRELRGGDIRLLLLTIRKVCELLL